MNNELKNEIEDVSADADTLRASVEAALAAGYELETIMQTVTYSFTNEQRAAFFLQCFTGDPCEPLSSEEKKFAVDLAEHFGPDWAQALYRFAVLVTKLA